METQTAQVTEIAPWNDDSSHNSARNENASDRLRRTLSSEVMTVDLVAAFAGDRLLTSSDWSLIERKKRRRGTVFYSDLLYAVSHHYFAPEVAEPLWRDVISHKEHTSKKLGRNIGITVAALDYLSNVTNDFAGQTLVSETFLSRMTNLAMRDGLTGLFNHSTFYELLDLEVRNLRRYGLGVSLLLLDIDNFKQVNDHKGHQWGDRTLVELAETLTSSVRDSDSCCRLGGDEFAVILRSTNSEHEACQFAERIRESANQISVDGSPLAVSIGVAICNDAMCSSRNFVEKADRALYAAKASGRDRVCIG